MPKSDFSGIGGLSAILILIFFINLSACSLASDAASRNLPLIPQVWNLEATGSTIPVKPNLTIITDLAAMPEAQFLQDKLRQAGLRVDGIQSPGLAQANTNQDSIIRLEFQASALRFPKHVADWQADAAYRLRISPQILIQANKPEGIFNGIATLLQLIDASPRDAKTGQIQIAEVDVQDFPRFAWRGSMLDSSRHFISVDYIKRHLDLMARYKLNVFHWHLSDDQGWRLPVRGRDRLTSVGAWRKKAEPDGPDEKYGGFYTVAEIRDIVAFAGVRHIMVVPEIDLPGHASAALASYPAIACGGKNAPHPKQAISEWGIFGNNLCPGKEASFAFVTDVVQTLTELFPGPYIHIGGDEIRDISSWESCPDCQERLQKLGLRETRQLERYFISRTEQIIRDHDRIPMAWDDVVHSVSQTSTLLQFWVNETNLAEGRDMGFQFVVSPGSYAYLDMNYGPPEIKRWAGHISLAKAYSIDPALWNLNDASVRGIEAPLWTEHIPDEAGLDYHIWPRLAAIAEAAWTPASRRDWDNFRRHLAAQGPIWKAQGLQFFPSPEIDWQQ